MACGKNCNRCEDNGCKDIVYPDCILTKIAYPCIGIGAGKTGSVLLSAINSRLCELQGRSVVVQGATQSWGSGDYETITVSPQTVEGVTTYTVYLGPVVLEFYQNLQTVINTTVNTVVNITEVLEDATAVLYDPTGGSLISDLDLRVSSLEGDVVTIQSDVSSILSSISTIESDITTLETAMTKETWKVIGGGGTFDNGQAVPAFNTPTAAAPVIEANYDLSGTTFKQNLLGRTTSVRKNIDGSVDIKGACQIDTGVINGLMFTLPTGYRPTEDTPLLAEIYFTTVGGSKVPDSLIDRKPFIYVRSNGQVRFADIDTAGAGVNYDVITVLFNCKFSTD